MADKLVWTSELKALARTVIPINIKSIEEGIPCYLDKIPELEKLLAEALT